jgi:hypothetical protein
MKLIRLVLFVLLLAASCETGNNKPDLGNLFQKRDNSHYVFRIKLTQDTFLTTKDGLVFFVPKNSLISKGGNEISEVVEIEVQVFRDLKNILVADLQTLSDDKLLISDGMFSIAGKTISGKEVFINKEEPVKLIASLSRDQNEMMLFKESSSNSSNWTSPELPKGEPIVIPFETLWKKDVDIYKKGGTEVYTWINEFYQNECKDTSLCSFDLLKYQHSFIATNEFWERYVAEYYSSHDWFLKTNDNDSPGIVPWLNVGGGNLVDMYASQTIWKVDSFILEEIKTNLNRFLGDSLKRIERHKEDINELEKSYTKSNIPKFTEEAKEEMLLARMKSDEDYISNSLEDIQKWERFKNQRLTTIDEIILPAIDTVAVLKIQKALKDEAILNLLNRKSYAYLASLSNKRTFSITKFGRYNLDRFLKSKLKNIELAIKSNSEKTMVFLLLKKNKVIIQPNGVKDNLLLFKRQLPEEEAFIVAVASNENTLLFAKKEIKIGQNEVEELELKPSSQEEISKVLEEIDKGYQ